jgi:hypothetical protein
MRRIHLHIAAFAASGESSNPEGLDATVDLLFVRTPVDPDSDIR